MMPAIEEVQQFLVENNWNATLLLAVDQTVSSRLPATWKLVIEEHVDKRVDAMIQVWQDNLSPELSILAKAFRKQLVGLYIIQKEETYSLLYAIENDGEIYYYEGEYPTELTSIDVLRPYWKQLPDKLKWFYENLHNGWFFSPLETLGLLPGSSLFKLSDKEWGILEGSDSIDLDLSKTVVFFHNGAGGYLCLNFERDIARGIVWWNDEEPSIGVDFWDYLDEWTTIGLEN